MRSTKLRLPIIFLLLIHVGWSAGTLGAQPNDGASNVFQTYADQHAVEIIDQLRTLVAMPNVSANQADIRLNADLSGQEFEQRGAKMELLEMPGANPVVFGEIVTAGAARTVMIYAHYDGQPVESALWQTTQPFEPALTT